MTDEINLERGGQKVVFKKIKDYFAIRLNHGRARDRKALQASCGLLKHDVEHIDCVAPAKMDVFATKDAKNLEDTMDTLRKSPASDVVTHMYSMGDSSGSPMVPTGSLTLQFSSTVSVGDREKILKDYGLDVLQPLNTLPRAYVVRLTHASKMNPLKIAAELQKKEEIEVAEPDFSFQVSFQQTSSDTLYAEQWHLNNLGGTGLKPGADAKAEGAWEITKGSRDIVVCVIDDGFDLDHPDFQGENKVVSPRDFGERDFDPRPAVADDNHGTACAGVAIAEENGLGVVGLAPRCAFMPVRMGPWLSDQSIEEMFRYAMKKKADVISCSWSAKSQSFTLTTRMKDTIHNAAVEGRSNNKGCVILFAAGNEQRPLKSADGISIHQGFALHPDVIAVAASNSLDKQSWYSNFGPELTLCAPSNGSPGRGVVTTDRLGAEGYALGDYTHDFGGTSSSTPLAAGLAALILSVNPDLTSAEVRRIMMDSADKIDEGNGNYVDGHSNLYGHGRINAQRALELLDGSEPPTPSLPAALHMEHRVNRAIPEKGEIEDTLPFPLPVDIRDIEVSIKIKHTYRGDLKLTLFSPAGDEIVLQTNSNDGEADIDRVFRSSNDGQLFAPVMGKSAQGDWRLLVEDMASGDEGILKNWGLTISYSS